MKDFLVRSFRLDEKYNKNLPSGIVFNLYKPFKNIHPSVVYVNERGQFKVVLIKNLGKANRETQHLTELLNSYVGTGVSQLLPEQAIDYFYDEPSGYNEIGYDFYGVEFSEKAFVVDVVGVSYDFFNGSSKVLSAMEQFYYKHMSDYNKIPKDYFREANTKLYMLRVGVYSK